LLAKTHIAPKELGISDEDVKEQILKPQFGKTSRGELTIMELQYLLQYFVQHGWKPKSRGRGSGVRDQQLQRLRERARDLAGQIENGERRLQGLIKKICQVERMEWCRDAAKFKRLLAVLEEIKRGQSIYN